MPTLLLSLRYSPDSIALWNAARALDWAVERISPNRLPELHNAEIVVYGEPFFAQATAQALNSHLVEPPLDWLTRLPHDLLRRCVQFMTLAEARKISKMSFVKPADDKCFVAQVYETGAAIPNAELLPDDLPVLVSEQVTWESEFRCFVGDGQVATLSPYARFGDLAQAEDGAWPATETERKQALAFAESVLQEPAARLPAFVLDVGKIEGSDWAVIEANPAWSSGIYGCEPQKVLTVLQQACVKEKDE